jgi:hypothetical protein
MNMPLAYLKQKGNVVEVNRTYDRDAARDKVCTEHAGIEVSQISRAAAIICEHGITLVHHREKLACPERRAAL